MLMVNGTGGRFQNKVRSMNVDNEGHVRINGLESKWLNTNSGMNQGCSVFTSIYLYIL